MKSEDVELIRRSQQGDVQAFNVLVERYQREILNAAIHMLGSLPDAEDVCQNSWLAAWKAIGRFRGGSFRAWLLRIVTNACKDLFRSRKKNLEIPGSDPLLENVLDRHDSTVLNHEKVDMVSHALSQLPDEQRLTLILREFNGLSYKEIALAMKCSIGTVRSRLNRGRINIRNLLRDKGFKL